MRWFELARDVETAWGTYAAGTVWRSVGNLPSHVALCLDPAGHQAGGVCRQVVLPRRAVQKVVRTPHGWCPARWAARELVAEVELLLPTRGPLDIAEHLGLRPDSVARRLARCGRADLGRPFWRAAQRKKLHSGAIASAS